ncbi:MAG: Type II secretory pathway, pullulanase PulA [Limimaricola sp.]|uniref:sulfotransferase family 2 domain-containing protein n=1 Tax=Limimaricola sp. TaxID=2211665 RepID=UPI001DC1C8B7|nr:sulfotransferase family 2 domain-containing protein [Limimaricola sp.]MBI1415731.1 Type II secretory pathway, pullulanase PulA [Limimaricola sp.]
MIVSRARRYIFVHIPKTGGTALTQALEARVGPDDILIGDTPKARRRRHRLKGLQAAGRLWKHSTLSDIAGLVTPEEMADFCIFTLVRNPWDRVVSYYHWLRAQDFAHPAVARAKALDFSAFLNHPATVASLTATPYSSYLTDAAGVERATLYLRLERLEEDLPRLAAKIGFLPEMERINVSDRVRDWRGFYSDEDAALLARIAATDIARFGYAFDPRD